ncbi:MAG TPA: CcmD family protein, partial [bacterium]
MKLLSVFWIFLMGAMVSSLANAQVPRLVHYQGMVKNEDGTPFNGAVNLVFSIYQRPLAETPLWSEVHRNVEIADGKYEVLLGGEVPLNLSFYEYFLEVRSEDGALKNPRTAIAGSGFNYRINFLFAAYTIVWFALFAYLVSISRRQK